MVAEEESTSELDDEEELSENEKTIVSAVSAVNSSVVIASLSTGYLTGDLVSTWSFINTL